MIDRTPPSGTLRRAAAVAAAVALVALTAACGGTDGPTARRTVTVEVPALGETSTTRTPSGTASSVPTQLATPAEVPTALAAGKQRGAPHSFAEAENRINRATHVAGASTSFQSPSGNIVCARGTGSTKIACEVKTGRIAPPLPTICAPGGPTDIGRIELRTDGAVPVCNSDTIRTGTEPKLPYGTRTPAKGSVACLSEEFGVTCIDGASSHGFFIARDTFVTF